MYPTVVSFSSVNLAVWAQTFAMIFNRFHWTSLSFIYDRSGNNSFYTLLANSLSNLLLPPVYDNVHLLTIPFDGRQDERDADRIDALKRARNVSRGEDILITEALGTASFSFMDCFKTIYFFLRQC